jgi:transposase
MVAWPTTMPRAADSSSTMRSPSGKRKYSHAAWGDYFGGEAARFAVTRTDPTTGKRKHYIADFKVKIALEAIQGEPTTSHLAWKRGVLQTMVNDWKRAAVSGLSGGGAA